jgi:hypothetical protein
VAHRVFILFLLFIGLTAVLAVGIHGCDYYLASRQVRAFSPEHSQLRPSGLVGHGLGIVGATMIISGVVLYSSRKRIRALWPLGKLTVWLEFHIFLCLVGPTLVIYHTTFKAGGIAGIALWTMLTVVASGLVGRFLYILIPRNVQGAQLDRVAIEKEFDRIGAVLRQSEFGSRLLRDVDAQFASVQRPSTLRQTVSAYLRMGAIQRSVAVGVRQAIGRERVPRNVAHAVNAATRQRASLIRRSLLLGQVEQLFYYWHVIHTPFAIIMGITLAIHVGVAIWLGYAWIF